MPYPNEHSCRLRDPGAFQADSFRRMKRNHDGKAYSVIVGQLKGKTATTEQAYRYAKSIWTAAAARAHCKSHDGIKFEPAGESSALVAVEGRQLRCAAQHFGAWAIEPYWFMEAVAMVKNGTFQAAAEGGQDQDSPGYEKSGNIAKIGIYGQMTKGTSSFGGTSTVLTRRAIRKAVNDDDVRALLLHIDSPGGTMAGTPELAAEVIRARTEKPFYAYIEDLGASAAYWIASQATRIAANATATVGSIGAFLMLYDESGKYEADGIKVHVVSTGEYKAAFAPGAEITDKQLEYAQKLVEEMNEHFLAAVGEGRGMDMDAVRKLADGRMHLAAKAKALGLIDSVETLDETVARMREEIAGQREVAARSFRLQAAIAGIGGVKAATSYKCECLKCGHKFESQEHCQEATCPKCGAKECRRASRPGPGR